MFKYNNSGTYSEHSERNVKVVQHNGQILHDLQIVKIKHKNNECHTPPPEISTPEPDVVPTMLKSKSSLDVFNEIKMHD